MNQIIGSGFNRVFRIFYDWKHKVENASCRIQVSPLKKKLDQGMVKRNQVSMKGDDWFLEFPNMMFDCCHGSRSAYHKSISSFFIFSINICNVIKIRIICNGHSTVFFKIFKCLFNKRMKVFTCDNHDFLFHSTRLPCIF